MKPAWYKVLPALVALVLAFVLSFVRIDDYDVWWHLKCGEMLVRRGYIPRNEIFSFTAAGRPWVDGYLPSQALLYLAYWIGNAGGICVLGALLVTGCFGIALAISRSGAQSRDIGFGAAIAVSLPAIYLTRVAMMPRPALLTPIFSLVALWLLEDHRLKGGKRVYWLLPLTTLWANCHPAFPLGFVITGAYLAGALLDSILKKSGLAAPPIRKLILLLGCQFLATLVNPYGHRIYYSAFAFASNPQLGKVIMEWMPLLAEPKEPAGIVPCVLALMAFWLAAALWGGGRVRIEYVLLFTFFTASTFYGRRNLVLFGPLSIPLISWVIAAGKPSVSGKVREILIKSGAALITATGLFFIWFAGTNRLYLATDSFRATGLGLQDAMFPKSAIDLLEKEHIEGQLLHSYGLGGYLIFRLYPKQRVFIDGRMYPYPYDVFLEEENAFHSEQVFETVRARHDIRCVLLTTYPQSSWATIYAFISSSRWATVAADGTGILLLARGLGNDEVIRRHEINLLKEPPSIETREAPKEFHWWSREEYPYGAMRWAYFYNMINRLDLATKALKPALNFRPVPENAEGWLAGLLVNGGKPEEGLALAQKVLAQEPKNVTALSALADYYLAKTEYDKAEEILLRVLRLSPALASAWNTLGDISYKRRDFTTAARRYKRAADYGPGEIKYWERLGMALQIYDPAGAIDAYQRGLELGRKGGSLPEDIDRIKEHIAALQKK